MKSLSAVFSELRKKGKSQYTLLRGCLFFATLLITAFCMMMYSPTVQNTLPEGGDSRKQVMMVFVLAVIGCAAFCVYAAGLFFRYKSRECGVFLALGMRRSALGRQMRREVLGITLSACGAGLVLGTPLCWLIWSAFRLTLVDTPEMMLIFDLRAYAVPMVFTAFVLAALLLMQRRFLARVNVMDIIQESHRAEPVRAVPRWYGWGGICLLVLGGVLGYFVPTFCVLVLHWYAPAIFTAPFYLPALVGLYWVLLYTVVGGWHRGKSRYAHLIESGMMQFQGRQTVRNMLVVTVLIAAAYFASFYTPAMMSPGKADIANRPMDYQFFYRADQDMIGREEIEALAAEHGVQIVDYVAQQSASLGVDGEDHIESEGPMGTTYTTVYTPLMAETHFVSVSAWNALTGDQLALQPGECAATLGYYGDFSEIGLITNPVTRETLPVRTVQEPLKSDMFQDLRVLCDADYDGITQGLTKDWQEVQVVFNAENDSYAFAKALLHTIVAHSGAEATRIGGYDRIVRERWMDEEKIYFLDPESPDRASFPEIDPSRPDSSDFRMNWMYMPKFRVLDQGDFLANFAVFLLLFVFIAILCFAAVAVILYTRSQTLILSNAWVYEDLSKLGASNAYLRGTASGQVKRVFLAPLVIGTLLILGFYTLILMGNGGDGMIDASERSALAASLTIVAVISAAFYGLYRFTVKRAWSALRIRP